MVGRGVEGAMQCTQGLSSEGPQGIGTSAQSGPQNITVTSCRVYDEWENEEWEILRKTFMVNQCLPVLPCEGGPTFSIL